MNIPAIIKEMVFTGGSLIVPGLGKFTIFRIPAEMDVTKKLITPPMRLVQFDDTRSRDDGKLTALLAERYGVGTAEADRAVNSWVRSVKNDLSEKGSSVIEGFGTLEKGDKGITFTDDPFILYSSLLPRIEFRTTPRNETHSITKKTPPPVSPGQRRKRRSVMVPLMIIILILAGAAAAVFYTGSYRDLLALTGIGDPDQENQNRIVFGKPPAEGDSLKETISRNIDESTLKKNALSYNQSEVTLPPAEKEAQPAIIPAENTGSISSVYLQDNKTNQITGYHIIAGSYLVPKNAERQQKILENKGFKSIILPPQGNYYMVSLGSYKSIEQVTEVMNSLRPVLDIPLWVKKI
jgi:hypothetical protein